MNTYKLFILVIYGLSLINIIKTCTIQLNEEYCKCKKIENSSMEIECSNRLNIDEFPKLDFYLKKGIDYRLILNWKSYTRLSNFSFQNFSIIDLNLAYNQLSYIEFNAFYGLNLLRKLILSNNKLNF